MERFRETPPSPSDMHSSQTSDQQKRALMNDIYEGEKVSQERNDTLQKMVKHVRGDTGEEGPAPEHKGMEQGALRLTDRFMKKVTGISIEQQQSAVNQGISDAVQGEHEPRVCSKKLNMIPGHKK